MTLAELREMYGNDIRVTRKAGFTLVHRDDVKPAVIRQRTADFDPDKYFCAECNLCQVIRRGGVVFFDEHRVYTERVVLEDDEVSKR